MTATEIIRTLTYAAASPRRMSQQEAQQFRDRAAAVATGDELRQIESLIQNLTD